MVLEAIAQTSSKEISKRGLYLGSIDWSRTKRVKYKKLHLALSTAGIQSACLSKAQRVDMKVFSKLWELGKWSGIRYVIADKGYDYFAVRTLIKKAKKTPIILRRANAVFPE